MGRRTDGWRVWDLKASVQSLDQRSRRDMNKDQCPRPGHKPAPANQALRS